MSPTTATPAATVCRSSGACGDRYLTVLPRGPGTLTSSQHEPESTYVRVRILNRRRWRWAVSR
jgi:hypothetical protein